MHVMLNLCALCNPICMPFHPAHMSENIHTFFKSPVQGTACTQGRAPSRPVQAQGETNVQKFTHCSHTVWNSANKRLMVQPLALQYNPRILCC